MNVDAMDGDRVSTYADKLDRDMKFTERTDKKVTLFGGIVAAVFVPALALLPWKGVAIIGSSLTIAALVAAGVCLAQAAGVRGLRPDRFSRIVTRFLPRERRERALSAETSWYHPADPNLTPEVLAELAATADEQLPRQIIVVNRINYAKLMKIKWCGRWLIVVVVGAALAKLLG